MNVPVPPSTAVVIAIAPGVDDRVRLAALVSDQAPLLLVSTAAEAVALLAGPAEEPVTAERPRTADVTGLHLDSDRRIAAWAGETVNLSPLEHDLLVSLAHDPGHTWTFARLHEEVWGNSHLGNGADVHSVVKRVRRKLRLLGSPLEIETVRGVGLRLVTLPADSSGAVPRGPVPVPHKQSR